MKNLIVFAYLIAACYAYMGPVMEDPQKKEWAEQCAKETGADLAEMLKGKEHMKKLIQQQSYKCFVKCYSMKTGLFNEKGEMNMDKLQLLKPRFPTADPAKLAEAGARCSAENRQPELCGKVSFTTRCIFEAMEPQ